MFTRSDLKEFLWRTTMPIWFSLLIGLFAGIVGGVGTYYIVPWINHELEMQRVKAEYLQDNIRNLNGATRELVDNITRLSHKTMDTGRVDHQLKREVVAQINKLQWRVIELDIIFSSEREQQLIDVYKDDASSLRKSVENLREPSDLEKVFPRAEDFSTMAYQLLAELYKKAGLSARVDPELKFEREDVGTVR